MIEPFYYLAVQWRNRQYDRNPQNIFYAHCPVISIGNLTTGGTGKTPMVVHIADQARAAGCRPAVVLRGYKQTGKGQSDEAMLMEQLLNASDPSSKIPVVINPDRSAAARQIAQHHRQVNLIILDDAFQHRRIARDLDIVLIDAAMPFGFEHLLPRGLLREPVGSLKRADAIIITHADAITPGQSADLDRRVQQFSGRLPIAHTCHRWDHLLDHHDQPVQPEPGTRVVAACGIGHPEAFLDQLGQQMTVCSSRILADHMDWQPNDLQQLFDLAQHHNAAAIVVTEKDFVKIRPLLDSEPPIPLWRPRLAMHFIDGRHALNDRIHRIINRPVVD